MLEQTIGKGVFLITISKQPLAFYKTFASHGTSAAYAEISPSAVAYLIHVAYHDLHGTVAASCQWQRNIHFVETMAHNGVFGPTAAVDISIGDCPASIPHPSKRPISGGSGEKSWQKRARRQQRRQRHEPTESAHPRWSIANPLPCSFLVRQRIPFLTHSRDVLPMLRSPQYPPFFKGGFSSNILDNPPDPSSMH